MRHDPHAYLHDVITAATNVKNFTQEKDFAQYCADLMTRSATERQFEVIGEALARLGRHYPELAARIPQARDIIDFRNIIAHGYDTVDNSIVWDVVQEHLDPLIEQCRIILDAPKDS